LRLRRVNEPPPIDRSEQERGGIVGVIHDRQTRALRADLMICPVITGP